MEQKEGREADPSVLRYHRDSAYDSVNGQARSTVEASPTIRCPYGDTPHPMKSQARLSRHLERYHGIDRPKIEPFERCIKIEGRVHTNTSRSEK